MASFYDCNGAMDDPRFAQFWAQTQPASLERALFHNKVAYFQHTSTAGRERLQRCQVPGCNADLSTEKAYSQRKRICSHHMQAAVLEYPGHMLCRYCFQCAKVEPIQAFDGTKRSCRHALHKRKERTTGTRLQVQHASATAAAAAFVKPEATDCALALHLHLQQQAQVLHLQQQQAAAAAAAELQQLQMQQQQQQQQMLVPVHSMSSGQVSAKLASLVAAAEQAQAMLAAVRAQVTSQQQLATTPSVCTADALVPDSNSRTASPQDAAASTAAAAADCPAEDAHCAAQAGCFQAPAAAAAAVTAADADAAADVDFEAFLDTLLTSDQPPASSSEQVVPAVSQGLSSGSSDQSTYLPAGLSPFAAAASLAAPPAPCFAGTSTPMTCAQIAPCMSVAASGSLPVGLGGFPSLGPAGGIVTATSTCSTGDVMAPQCGAAAQVGAVQQLESLNAMLQQVQSHVLALMQTSQVSQADTVTYY